MTERPITALRGCLSLSVCVGKHCISTARVVGGTLDCNRDAEKACKRLCSLHRNRSFKSSPCALFVTMSLPLRPLSSLWLLASCALLVARSAAGDAHNATAVPVIAEPSPRVTTWRDHIPADWTTDDVFRFLESLDLAKHRDLFDSEEVDGRALLALTHDSPVVLEMLPAGDRATLLEAVGRLDRSPSTLRLPQGATVATWAARRPRNWTRDDVLRWCYTIHCAMRRERCAHGSPFCPVAQVRLPRNCARPV